MLMKLHYVRSFHIKATNMDVWQNDKASSIFFMRNAEHLKNIIAILHKNVNLLFIIKFTFILFSFRFTFLHRASAMMVIKFPGKPTNINTMHVADANVNRLDEYPSNSGISSSGTVFGKSAEKKWNEIMFLKKNHVTLLSTKDTNFYNLLIFYLFI